MAGGVTNPGEVTDTSDRRGRHEQLAARPCGSGNGGIGVVHRDRALEADGADPAELADGVERADRAGSAAVGGVDVEELGRAPGLELPPDGVLVEAARRRDVVGVNGEVGEVSERRLVRGVVHERKVGRSVVVAQPMN
jgi:hypothetical protein